MVVVTEYGAIGDGITLATVSFQNAIDAAAHSDKKVVIPSGQYLIGSIFLASGINMYIQDGAELIGSSDITDYPLIDTRIAGVEMKWPAAMINAINANNISINGSGTINGNGRKWWELYWGKDGKGGRRVNYDAQGLRWIADYEIQRPRLVLIQNSQDVNLSNFHAMQSGFWNIQITYCSNVNVIDLNIDNNEGPSTDGIDIDSSQHVLIDGCRVSCNDDGIVIKSGRDGNGAKINKQSKDIEIRNCELFEGCGICIGSEVSGGVSNINIHHNYFENSSCGFRIKSSPSRGNKIEGVKVDHLTMKNVRFPFQWQLNWHPLYNRTAILTEAEYGRSIPDFWYAVADSIPQDEYGTMVKNIDISNINIRHDPNNDIVCKVFDIEGYPQKPMEQIKLQNIQYENATFGNITGIRQLDISNLRITNTYFDKLVDNINRFDSR